MKVEIEEIKLQTEYPCLMNFLIQGEILVGTYMVAEGRNCGDKGYWVTQLIGDEVGKSYFKQELSPEEWVHLPVGTKISITN